ncbi:AMIN domain-containing protein [uncultured Thermosynechococcus sp.]|uniref:AMIN domain-containing protein n=1 Tax=uncultured Thermosynechococcus sp. TaxID=436945 RepID=UPI00261365AD|nr:AMIN domain-containing protein [uncultured Thermosynechococcus sp.]
MSQLLHRLGLGVATTALIAASQTSTWAAATEITGIRLVTVANGIQLLFNVQGNLRPAVFTVNRGNASIADIANSQLRLPQGGAFRQDNPAPGISSVEVVQLDAKTIRVTVNGISAAPIGEVIREGRNGLQINFITAQGPAGPQVSPSGQPMAMPPGPNPVPPFLPRPVPPPVGDMLISPLNADPDVIQLGTNERIPRLLLREAPVREVLSLLARAANMNVVFPEAGGQAGGVTISLDIENESVQDVFNYILRVTNLKANRQGRTIFVGQDLPPDAQNRIVRTIRLNQLRATLKSTISRTLSSSANTGGTVGGGGGGGAAAATTAQTSLNRQLTTTENEEQRGGLEILEAYGANSGGQQGGQGRTLLAGLEAVADSRTNTITLIGPPRKVEMAIQLLQQYDVRRRQVMVNVKFIDVNLLRSRVANIDLITNFGGTLWGAIFSPDGLTVLRGTTPSSAGLTAFPINSPVGNLLSDFFAQLRLSLQTGNAVVLANPTLVIQEGSAAQVNLTQEIFSGIESTAETTGTGGGAAVATQTIRPIIRPAGVIFNVTVEQIDDNGFVTLQLSPEVSAPAGIYNVIFPGAPAGSIGTLLSQRRMESGRIRLRDGQTLMLAGIIQDQDRSLVTKVPILGDIPLLGRLFRREQNQRQRNELVVMVTPKIIDDTQNAGFGYQYSPTPGSMPPEVQNQILQPPQQRF